MILHGCRRNFRCKLAKELPYSFRKGYAYRAWDSWWWVMQAVGPGQNFGRLSSELKESYKPTHQHAEDYAVSTNSEQLWYWRQTILL
jgi:hypothetical protein